MFIENRTLRCLLTACLTLLLAGCAAAPGTLRDTDHPLAGRLWDVAAKSFIDEAELLRRAKGAQVLLLGETHDNSEHHRLQLKVLRARLETGARPALLMEQFNIDQQEAINAALLGGSSLEPLMPGWGWKYYEPLITLAKGVGIPLRAANLPRSATRPVVRDGYSTLAAGEVQRLALEAVWDDSRQNYMTKLIEESHCGQIGPELRDGLVRAQRLRDATLADAALKELDIGVVFILGRGHARRDVGVPRYIESRRAGTPMLSVGFVEVDARNLLPGHYETDQVGQVPPYDVVWFTSRAERPDPCLAFGKK